MSFWRPQPDFSMRSGTEQATKPLIVVVDDDRDTRELYRAFFDLSGFRTAEAEDGSQALAMARQLLPDILLTDLVLPDSDGLSVARLLKDDPRTSWIRVLLVTGCAFDGLDRRAADAGVERVLIKPCLPQAMLREVQRAMSRPACASASLKHPLPERDVAVRNQQHDRAAAVVYSQRQDL